MIERNSFHRGLGKGIPKAKDSDESEAIPVLWRLDKLCAFFGDGRKLTSAGNITLADARILTDLLDLGESLESVFGSRHYQLRSSGELMELPFLVKWALAVGALRKIHGKLAATKAWSRLNLDTKRLRVSQSLVDLGPLRTWYDVAGWHTIIDDQVGGFLRRLTQGPISLDRAAAELHSFATAMYEFSPPIDDSKFLLKLIRGDIFRLALFFVEVGLLEMDIDDDLSAELRDEPVSNPRFVSTQRAGEIISKLKIAGELPNCFSPGLASSDTAADLNVRLEGIEPVITRDFTVPSTVNLAALHVILQEVMGWENSHLHEFRIGSRRFGDPEFDEFGEGIIDDSTTRLCDVLSVRESLVYAYDFGDDWTHTVTFVGSHQRASDEPQIFCSTGSRRCPPEDVGGVWGYERMLEVLRNPDDEERESYLEWLGGDADPDGFDLELVNLGLGRLFE